MSGGVFVFLSSYFFYCLQPISGWRYAVPVIPCRPHIKIRGEYREAGFLVRFENTFSNPLKEKNGAFQSTKHGGPGIGTESVKKLVQQYQGTVGFAKEGKPPQRAGTSGRYMERKD